MQELISRYPSLEICKDSIIKAKEAIISCYEKGGKLLLCGNGGSCADCEHIVGELMKGFLKKRPISEKQKDFMKSNCEDITDDVLDRLQGALPAIALPSCTALNSAFCNDVDPDLIYAQGVLGLGKKEDVLVAISTSGNSKNVLKAAQVAKALGITVISLTGKDGGKLRFVSDVCIIAPEHDTYKIQELHLPIYHTLCAEVEAHFFAE